MLGATVALLAAVGLTVAQGWHSGVSLAAGYAVGVFGFAGLAGVAAALSGSGDRRSRVPLAGMHLVKFPLLLVVLYLLLIPGHCHPVWLVVGYTVALVAFVCEISGPRAPQASGPAADTHE